MILQNIIDNLSQRLQIAPLHIVREIIEIEILEEISKTDLSSNIIFYGGTALRLAHHSFRFSEDLDFLLTKEKKENIKHLTTVLNAVSQKYSEIKIEEIIEKRNTLFGLLKITPSFLKHSLRIKIEISKKQNGINKENLLLTSPATPLEVVFPTADLPSLQKAKIKAIENRNLPRDWFDLWYINTKLGENIKPDKKFNFNKYEFKRELRRFIPQNKWSIIDTVINYYA